MLVADGEWHRLLAANFLHLNLLHLYMNGIGVLVLGVLVERLVGPWRLLCIYLISAVAGAAASALTSGAALSVGASTAVFGLLGAHAWINWRCRASLPGGFGQPLRAWLVVGGINVALPFVVPAIDWAAHAGGFFAGLALAAGALRGERAEQLGRPAGFALGTATTVLVAAHVVALGQAVAGALESDGSARLRIANELVSRDATPAGALSRIARHYATDPAVTAAELALAERAAMGAVELAPRSATFVDALATVRFRDGDLDAAVKHERRAVRLDTRRVLVSRMARFLDARLAERGPFTLGGTKAGTVTVAVARSGSDEPTDSPIVVDLAESVDRGLEIYALDERAGRLLGTLRILVGAGTPAGRHRLAPPKRAPQPSADELRVAYLDASGCRCAPRTLRGRYFALSPEARRLPSPAR